MTQTFSETKYISDLLESVTGHSIPVWFYPGNDSILIAFNDPHKSKIENQMIVDKLTQSNQLVSRVKFVVGG